MGNHFRSTLVHKILLKDNVSWPVLSFNLVWVEHMGWTILFFDKNYLKTICLNCIVFWSKFSEKTIWVNLFFSFNQNNFKRQYNMDWIVTLLKKRLWHRCFPVIFAKFLRTLFSQNTSGGCFCFSSKII